MFPRNSFLHGLATTVAGSGLAYLLTGLAGGPTGGLAAYIHAHGLDGVVPVAAAGFTIVLHNLLTKIGVAPSTSTPQAQQQAK